MKIFEELISGFGVRVMNGESVNVIKECQSFLTSLYTIAAEQRIEEIKSEIKRLERMKKNENISGKNTLRALCLVRGQNIALSDYLTHLQEKLKVVEKDLETLKEMTL